MNICFFPPFNSQILTIIKRRNLNAPTPNPVIRKVNWLVKGILAVRIEYFFFILNVANTGCFILIAVEICHNIIRK
jgi:hypothetical protein